MESGAEVGKQVLSAADRLRLIQTLNTLPPNQFDAIVLALNPPGNLVPDASASRGKRSKAFLEWVASPNGLELLQLETFLDKYIKPAAYSECVIQDSSREMTHPELATLVSILRSRTGDESIGIKFFKKSKGKLCLSGSSEALEKLQELFEVGRLHAPELPLIKSVQRISNDQPDARKARLIQALRLRKQIDIAARDGALDRARASAHDLEHALERALDRAHASAREVDFDCDFDLDFDRAINRTSNLEQTLDWVLDFALTHPNPRTRALALVLALDLDLANALARARARARAFTQDFDHIFEDRDHTDLENADLSGANLSNLDLRGINLQGADLTHADVSNTLFGKNPGLTKADELDLIARGAIFPEPPDADVSALVK
ncbi:MAG: pentapeptide repeat-containing protein [Cyanobacteria bacterium J06639_14]